MLSIPSQTHTGRHFCRGKWGEHLSKALLPFALFVGLIVSWFVEFPEKKSSDDISITLPPIPPIPSPHDWPQGERERKGERKMAPEEERPYNVVYVDQLYSVIHNRRASDREKSRWFNVMEQGGTREGIYRALVLGHEYARRERGEAPGNEAIVDFTRDYAHRYLAHSIGPEALRQANVFFLKRLVTEKTLDVLDAFLDAPREDSLHRWYAVFSAEMAREFPSFLQGKMRKETSKRWHLKWAMAVPPQHLKGEVILKLHMVYNGLYE